MGPANAGSSLESLKLGQQKGSSAFPGLAWFRKGAGWELKVVSVTGHRIQGFAGTCAELGDSRDGCGSLAGSLDSTVTGLGEVDTNVVKAGTSLGKHLVDLASLGNLSMC